MPVHCIDGDITDLELALWEVALPPTRIALRCEEVRAVFVGQPLARGIALLGLTRAQFKKLFPERSRQKNAYNLIRFASRIRGEEARRVLAAASWHQLRAAADHEGDEAQIRAALLWMMGFGREEVGARRNAPRGRRRQDLRRDARPAEVHDEEVWPAA